MQIFWVAYRLVPNNLQGDFPEFLTLWSRPPLWTSFKYNNLNINFVKHPVFFVSGIQNYELPVKYSRCIEINRTVAICTANGSAIV